MISFVANKYTRALNLAIALVVAASLASAAKAQNAFTVNLSEKKDKLANPTDMMWDKWVTWDLGSQRMRDRNSPYLEVTNNSTSTSPITEFHLTIGDNRFNFGPVDGTNLAALGSTTPGFALTSSTVNNAGDELVVDIGNGGLLPGQTVRFKIKLNVDPSFAAQYAASFGTSLPDYRTVLFDMNGLNVYDGITKTSSDDNAQASVVFTPGGKSSAVAFPDEQVTVSQYYNSNLRPYSATDPVLIFQLNGTQVPEPTSIGLAFLGLSAIAFRRGARR
ncbi:MAG TPA: PEP-CTERM sorting domain-containing protein [Lacipirellulaceae bacterium]|nr:PEP-CTERM sorting domain-containing protein [Lacipirellulaceae bacterium]